MIGTVEMLEAYVKERSNIYLFGAGRRARYFIELFRIIGFEFDGCIVSERGRNPAVVEGVPVYALDELGGCGKKPSDLNILVSVRGTMEELLCVFQNLPAFKSILLVNGKLDLDIHNKWSVKCRYEERQSDYILDIAYPKVEFGMGILIERQTGRPLMRVPYYLGMLMLESLLEGATRSAYEREFGRLAVLPHVEESGIRPDIAMGEKVQIYVATSHLDKAEVNGGLPGGYAFLQVGAALTEMRKGCRTDDTGDNISCRNRDYCECTGLYWIWKNTSGQKYVGLSHYRRRLMLDDRALQFIKEQDIDIIPTLPQYEVVSVKEFFADFIEELDWKLLKRFVSECDGEYAECFEEYENGHFYFPCNVMLWKREWFDRYCEFAFSVADKVERVYGELGVVRGDRYMGYLFEQLSSLFIMRHRGELRVACAEMEWLQ